MPQLKTAYLILAHDQPDHLARLVRILDHADAVFFIHIDRKTDEGPFRAALGERRNAVFVEERYDVYWGGFSQVEATLALLSAAFAFAPPFNRYCLLSGSDYPIKSNSLIQAEFASGKEFIRIDRKIGASENNAHCKKVLFRWSMDTPDPGASRCFGKRAGDPYNRIGLYHGSQWWAFTHSCVEYILRFVSSNADYYEFFRDTLCPDEIFFHSIVKNSPFASAITHDFETAPGPAQLSRSNEHGCHYIDWNAQGEDSLPKVLDLADLDQLRNSKAVFARKFRNGRSTALLQTLENQLARQAGVK